MDLESVPPLTSEGECASMNRSYSGTWLRSVKRKFQEFEVEKGFVVPGLDVSQVAKVELGNECIVLREMVSSQQQTVLDLTIELEAERYASSSSANEAMSMILRLQREKAEVQMEFRQFKRFAEERMAHDREEILDLEDLLHKGEQVIESLTCEIESYKHRMMSYGLTEAEAEGQKGIMSRNYSMDNLDTQYEIPTYDYPPIKCTNDENNVSFEVNNDVVDVDKHVFGERPQSRDHLKDLENRINQLEQSPTQSQPDLELSSPKNVLEKVIVGHSPRRYRHLGRYSSDSLSAVFATVKDTGLDVANDSPRLGSAKKKECVHVHLEDHSNLRKVDTASEVGDDMSDRVYTIDSIHHGVPYNSLVGEAKSPVKVSEDYLTMPKESLDMGDIRDPDPDPDIKKLYMRLQALEADRESMRQALMSMGTDKAQLVLLKEIAQQLRLDMSPARTLPVRKESAFGSFSIFSIFKWIVSFVFWRKKPHQSRYMFGISANNAGLLTLLDKGPRVRQWRCISGTQV